MEKRLAIVIAVEKYADTRILWLPKTPSELKMQRF
jgi:hypothetical protein